MSAQPQRFRTGVIWSGATAAAGVLLPFLLFIYFARAVAPADIGLVAIAMASSEILKAVGLPGLYEALLQQRPIRHSAYETAMALLLCAGVLLATVYVLVLFLLGQTLQVFHHHFALLATIGLRIPLDLASVQPQAALAERLAYRRLALRTIIGNGLAGCVGIGVAHWASPLQGLVFYQVGQSVLTCLVTMVGGKTVAWPRLHRADIDTLAGQTIYATGNRLVAATINSLDQLVLAAVAGNVATAYYNVGKRLETTFVTVANSFTSVLFQPMFSRLATPELPGAVRRGLLTVFVTCGLPAAIVATNASGVIALLFGPQWREAASVASLLALSGLARGIGMIPGALLSVSGRNRDLLATSIVSAAGSLATVAFLGSVSLSACAAGMAVKNAAIALWLGVLTRHQAGPATRRYVIEIFIPFLLLLAALIALRFVILDKLVVSTEPSFPLLVSSLLAALLASAYLLTQRSHLVGRLGVAVAATGAGR